MFSSQSEEIVEVLTKVSEESSSIIDEQRLLLTYLRSPMTLENNPKFNEQTLIQAALEISQVPDSRVTSKIFNLLNRELELIENARKSVPFFFKYLTGLIPPLHIVFIANKVQSLVDDKLYPYEDIVVNTPPGSAKSTLISNVLATFLLARSHHQLLFLANTADRAEHWGRIVRNNLQQAPTRIIFPHAALSSDSKSASKFNLTNGSVMETGGCDKSVLGVRASVILMDDVIKDYTDAQSVTLMGKLEENYENNILTRLLPTGKVICISQRLSDGDITAIMENRVLKGGHRRLEKVVITMEAEENDCLGREVGERLWADWYTEQNVIDAKSDNFKWSTLYQQRPPSSVGAFVLPSECVIVDQMPHLSDMVFHACLDLAQSDGKGDWSVILIIGVDESTGRCYVVDLWKAQTSDLSVVADALIEFDDQYKLRSALCDKDNLGTSFKTVLRQTAELSRKPHPPLFLRPLERVNKEVRASPLRSLFKRRLMFFMRAAWNSYVISQLRSFRNGMTGSGVDDVVDALAIFGKEMATVLRVPVPKEPPRERPPALVAGYNLDEFVDNSGKSFDITAEGDDIESQRYGLQGRQKRLGGSDGGLFGDGLSSGGVYPGRDKYGRIGRI